MHHRKVSLEGRSSVSTGSHPISNVGFKAPNLTDETVAVILRHARPAISYRDCSCKLTVTITDEHDWPFRRQNAVEFTGYY
jgi:hypothetical protein